MNAEKSRNDEIENIFWDFVSLINNNISTSELFSSIVERQSLGNDWSLLCLEWS